MATQKNVRDVAEKVIHRVLTDTGRPTRDLEDDDTLIDSIGLDSLDLAVLVVRLEEHLGVDPFREGAEPVRTFGALVSLYEARLAAG